MGESGDVQAVVELHGQTDYRHVTDVRRSAMSSHVYKLLELTGSSPISIEEAVQNAITKAHETVRNIQWFNVTETRGHVIDGKVAHWQVSIKLGFTLE
jgi:flavin-binding protein dodecin